MIGFHATYSKLLVALFSDLEPETPLQPGVGDGEEGEEVAAEAEEDVERVEYHGQGRGALVALKIKP